MSILTENKAIHKQTRKTTTTNGGFYIEKEEMYCLPLTQLNSTARDIHAIRVHLQSRNTLVCIHIALIDGLEYYLQK